MAAVAVTADNTREEDAEATTGWTNIGGGGGIALEGDIVYSGTYAASRKISTTTLGRGWDGSSDGPTSVNMTSTDRATWLCKITATNPAALQNRTTPALEALIGTGTGAYYHYYVAGADFYPAKAGWLLVPIDPNVSGYRNNTTGSPGALTAVDFYGVQADFTAGSKSENVAIDAIDVGAGLHLVGGDGADTDGVFQDFADADEGTQTNRWGYVVTTEGIFFVNGRLSIGESTAEAATATVFQDTGSVLVWNNGYFATGYAKLRFNLGGTGTDIDLTGCTLISRGEDNNSLGLGYTTTEDTRLQIEATGTTGALDLTDCNATNLTSITLTSACTIDGGSYEAESITQGTAEIKNCTITTTSAADGWTIADPTFGTTSDLHDIDFVQGGAGHALEIDTTGTYTLTNITFTGYGADTTSSAAIDVTTTAAVTINWTGGTEPTYKTDGTSNVTVQNTVTLTVTTQDTSGAAIASARVRIQEPDGTLISQGTTNGSGIYTDSTYNYTADTNVEVIARKSSSADDPRYQPIVGLGTITGDFDLTLTMIEDSIA